MSTLTRTILSFLLVALLAGCDTTQSGAKRQAENSRLAEASRMRAVYLERVHNAESEVWDILDPLMKKAADYREEETFGYIGAVFVSEQYYGEVLVNEARAEGFGPFVSVLGVQPDSPAESVGLRAGDRLISINEVKAPTGRRSAIFAAKRIKRLLEPEVSNRLVIERNGEELELEVVPIKGSYYGVVVMPSNAVDLHVDGDVIWIGLSLVESLRDRKDLSYVCAYALAKSVMRHPKQKGKNAFFGQLADIAALASGVSTGGIFGSLGGGMYAHGFEVEADLIALYLLASADYEIDGYPDYWEETFKRRSRKGIVKAKEQERLDIARKVIVAIATKRAAGEEVFPEEYLSGDVSEIEFAEDEK